MSARISSLQAATTPSRESLGPTSLAAEFELPDFISPPPSNDRERRAWDQFSDRMNRFHDRWKRLFTELILAAEKQATAPPEKKKPISHILALADQLLQFLEMHHAIEEQNIFPILAQKMTVFHHNAAHLDEHAAIHAGLDNLAAFLLRSSNDESTYTVDELRSILTSFGPILFYHMDAEVQTLKGDNLRRYYTLKEVTSLRLQGLSAHR